MSSSISGMFQNYHLRLDAPVKKHLKNVYACLGLSVTSFAVGGYVQMYSSFFQHIGFLPNLISTFPALALFFSSDNGKNRLQRLSMLLGFAFLNGVGFGPLMSMAMMKNPAIIPSSFLMAISIFAAFSGMALYAPSRQYLYLGGVLLSALSSLFWLSLISYFAHSYLIFKIQLWAGLAVFCGFVVFDTQNIIQKCEAGDKDFIRHSVDLFIDFVNILKDIMIILMDKEKPRDKKNQNSK
uniref:Bax inhibitor 1 n=1 Tax=Lepeophtheirus salmonis TaxID=72036 RepID=D3PGL5_LEPSM|nr:Bax inhibitor 1 [Lepeophtheirus salmonis]